MRSVPAVWINDHIPIVSEMPHGGVKQSGYGKDMSQYAFDEYTAVKHAIGTIAAPVTRPSVSFMLAPSSGCNGSRQ